MKISTIMLAALRITVAGAAVAQQPAGSIPDAVAIPDFSGIWAHSSWPGFEPP
jgi:hypothetical protein